MSSLGATLHPLLRDRRSLVGYLAFWSAAALVPATVVEPQLDGSVLSVSLLSTLSFALLSLPTWYLSRALPRGPFLALAAYSVAGVVWTVGFRLLWEIYSQALASLPEYAQLARLTGRADLALWAVGSIFYALVATFHHTLVEVERSRAALKREASLTLTAERAELAALRAQVHPHFLFNALNTISSLTAYDAGLARTVCQHLADYLRASLSAQDHPIVLLQDEWALCESYLKVESVRLGDRLRVEPSFSHEALTFPVPSLLLQPLIENAVSHGISKDERPEPLTVSAAVMDNVLTLQITNSYVSSARRSSLGRGLANVRARVEAHYGHRGSVHVEPKERYFEVRLRLPRLAEAERKV